MTSLKQDIADFFPDRYNDDNWKDLIPEYIDRNITLYNELKGAHRITVERWKADGCIGPEPAYPILPEEFERHAKYKARLTEHVTVPCPSSVSYMSTNWLRKVACWMI